MGASSLSRPTTPGDVLFARYAFPPNELGYCGPDDAGVLLSHASTGGVGRDIAERARKFDGAWPYLEVIAAAAGLDDPLDPRVVEAYWVGNDLLDDVGSAQLLAVLRERFAGQVGGCWDKVSPDDGPLAHHSFQVFAVYPWVGLLRSASPVPLSVLDRCRIRWGTVVGLSGEQATVSSRPLVWDREALGLGAEREEQVRWAAGGQTLSSTLAIGDLVSLHWDWVCDRLSTEQAAALECRSARQLDLASRYA
jgi:Family of unknown function (DUF6390)